MDLGTAFLRRNGINSLSNAVHPRHGLTWTDGTAIYLSPLRLHNGNLEKAATIKLGAFESVRSLHWSGEIGPKSCYLSVVHDHNVSIWKVDGEVPKLKFKQVRKINTSPIPQGCLWNPSNDILCLLCRDGCSFYFKHVQNKGSYAFPPLESGRISCGVWSEDGSKLAVCLDSLLLVYSWPDIDSRVSEATPTAWRVPGQRRRITSIISLSSNMFVLSAEVPLESHCQAGAVDTFILPDSSENEVPMLSTQDKVKRMSVLQESFPKLDIETIKRTLENHNWSTDEASKFLARDIKAKDSDARHPPWNDNDIIRAKKKKVPTATLR